MHSAPVQDEDNIAGDRSESISSAEDDGRDALGAALSGADVIRIDLATPAPYQAVFARMNKIMDEIEAIQARKKN